MGNNWDVAPEKRDDRKHELSGRGHREGYRCRRPGGGFDLYDAIRHIQGLRSYFMGASGNETLACRVSVSRYPGGRY